MVLVHRKDHNLSQHGPCHSVHTTKCTIVTWGSVFPGNLIWILSWALQGRREKAKRRRSQGEFPAKNCLPTTGGRCQHGYSSVVRFETLFHMFTCTPFYFSPPFHHNLRAHRWQHELCLGRRQKIWKKNCLWYQCCHPQQKLVFQFVNTCKPVSITKEHGRSVFCSTNIYAEWSAHVLYLIWT